jgi:hypothetical protein
MRDPSTPAADPVVDRAEQVLRAAVLAEADRLLALIDRDLARMQAIVHQM